MVAIDMKWKEVKDKTYETRSYSVKDLKELFEFVLRYIDNDEIEWIKVYI